MIETQPNSIPQHHNSHVSSGKNLQEQFVLQAVFLYGKYSYTDINKYSEIEQVINEITFLDSETDTLLIIDYNGFSLLQILSIEEGDL